jgi:hypothetical protein
MKPCEIIKLSERMSIQKDLSRMFLKACLSKDFDKLFCLVESQARIWLFLELQDEMDDATYFRYLGETLTFTYVSFDPELFKYLWNHPNRDLSLRNHMMSKEERSILYELPPEVTIFRGNSIHKEVGFSWSLSKEIATPFAKRHHPQRGQLIEGTCHKSKIIAYFSREKEILIDPKHIVIQVRTFIEPGESVNTYRINRHDQVWHQIKKSASYKKIKKSISYVKGNQNDSH